MKKAKSLKTGEFKNKLSAHLRYVRKGGELLLCDREEPIAKVLPFKKAAPSDLVEIAPEDPDAMTKLRKMKFKALKKKPSIDTLSLLKELRGSR